MGGSKDGQISCQCLAQRFPPIPFIAVWGEASYRERVESLIEQIKKNAFNPLLGDGEICPSSYDLLQRFFIVDVVQRLGIHRFFEVEIKALLDYTDEYCRAFHFSIP
ncbi:hypothetical protein SUGI_0793220 [Cryptomeria japonica]|nr:hypothetical protein SUGI_0793220 [Cryptomeria japonica]